MAISIIYNFTYLDDDVNWNPYNVKFVIENHKNPAYGFIITRLIKDRFNTALWSGTIPNTINDSRIDGVKIVIKEKLGEVLSNPNKYLWDTK